jgi:hypothetical protein
MHGPRALASGLLLALLLGACGTSASLVPTETPRPTSVERCAGLRWTDVRDALAAVDHYTYRGTDRIVFDPTVPGPSPVVADRTVNGAYQAPDRAREISEWAAGIDPMARLFEYPDFVLIGDQEWARVPGEDLWHDTPGRFSLTPEGGALDDLLAKLHARAPWSTGQPDPARPSECIFAIASATTAEGRHFDASLWADATTLLPTRLLRHEADDATGSTSTFDVAIDPTGQASIEPPNADEIVRETEKP